MIEKTTEIQMIPLEITGVPSIKIPQTPSNSLIDQVMAEKITQIYSIFESADRKLKANNKKSKLPN